MKRQDCQILMVAAIAAMLLLAVVPCTAGWYYITSDVCDGDPYGYDYESGSNYEIEWEYSVTNIDTSADSGGASASADCDAWAGVEVTPSGTSVDKSAWAGAETWGESYYGNSPYDPNAILYYDWSVSGSGTVTAEGGVNDSGLASWDSAYSGATAAASISCEGGSGSGGASGSVSEFSTGSASYALSGEATEDYGTTTESAGYYYATLTFSVSGGSDGPVEYEGSQFTAGASLGASASSSAAVSASYGYSGSADAGAHASCSGSSSVSVSY